MRRTGGRGWKGGRDDMIGVRNAPDRQERVLRLLLAIFGTMLGAIGWWRWAGL